MERTLIILKPETVQRGLIGAVITRFEQRGLKLVGLKMIAISPELAAKHYSIHQGKPFYEGLVTHITSSPVIVGVVEGPKAISVVRTTVGATNAAEATPGSIRGDFALEIGYNIVHASDGPETAVREVALFFDEAELVSYGRDSDRWITEEV